MRKIFNSIFDFLGVNGTISRLVAFGFILMFIGGSFILLYYHKRWGVFPAFLGSLVSYLIVDPSGAD